MWYSFAMKKTIHKVKASTVYKREHKADYGREKIRILYEDEFIAVIEKPCGILSVPYPGSKSRTVQGVLEKIMRTRGDFSAFHKPFPVHRLDRDTSGVMMFALDEKTQKKIVSTWHKMVSERLYRAVAENPEKKFDELPFAGTIDLPLAKNAYNVGYVPKSAEKVETVKAVTHYKIILRGKTHTLFELSLDTGKKNQIRAHLSSLHYPLAGDENYRAKTDPFHRLALHARTLEFVHPRTGKKMRFEIPEPAEWAEYVEKGDENPAIPVWREEKFPQKKSGAENFSSQKIESRRNLHKMDFIARGKFRGK
jgi:23S rRNA pseudouridine1911/1915/1917 synthase